jgi:hypothetical protein
VPVIEELRSTVEDAGAEVERVDHLLDAAESISSTVDSATRLSNLAFRAPLIRFVAFFKGIGRFLARLVRLRAPKATPRAGAERASTSSRREAA